MVADKLKRAMALMSGKRDPFPPRQRIFLDMAEVVLYAVGDVHGCHEQLRSLESKIVADAASFGGRRAVIVMLGDYIDRGAFSAQVIDHLLRPPPDGFERICLAGNHEDAMLRFLDGLLPLDAWLAMGGRRTLLSYGLDPDHLANLHQGREPVDDLVRHNIPAEHVAFLRSLSAMVYSERFVFVHAGIRPGIGLKEQEEADLLTIRAEFFDNSHLLDRMVVHGHTPLPLPHLDGLRLNIDTGVAESGRLTAVRFADNKARVLFS